MKLQETNEYFKPSLYEMSNFWSTTTGLSPGTTLFVRTEPNELPHTKYRIKIDHPQKGSAVFAIWGDEPKQVAGDWKVSGKDLKQITHLIKKTHDNIRNHIDGLTDSAGLTHAFVKAKNEI